MSSSQLLSQSNLPGATINRYRRIVQPTNPKDLLVKEPPVREPERKEPPARDPERKERASGDRKAFGTTGATTCTACKTAVLSSGLGSGALGAPHDALRRTPPHATPSPQ